MSTSLAVMVKRKGTTLTYVKSAGDAMQVTRDPVDAQLTITYDEDEKRLPVETRMSYHQAFRALRRETGQRMAVINASAETGTIYGMEEARATQLPARALPLTYLVDLNLRGDPRTADGQPVLAAIFLGEAHRTAVPLVLIAINSDRTMVLHDPVPSVADFATTVANVLCAMVAANTLRDLDFDPRQASRSDDVKARLAAFIETRVVVRTIFDLAAWAGDAKGYPREPLYRGIPHNVLTRGAFIASTTALVVASLAAASAEWTRRSAVAEAGALEQALGERREQVRAELLDRLGGLASRTSLQPGALFEAAEALAAQGGKVSLVATLDEVELYLEVPHLAGGSNAHGAMAKIDPEDLIRALRTSPPSGWAHRSLETSGDLNAWTLRFARAPLERDLLDLVARGESPGPRAVAAGGSSHDRAASGARSVPLAGR